MESENLTEVRKKILELQQQEKKLEDEQSKDKIAEFLKLEWTKDCEAFLKIYPYAGAGMDAYSLVIPQLKTMSIGKFYPSIAVLFVFGDPKKSYEYNISYRQSSFQEEYPCLATSDPKTLIEFLNKVKFKKVHYDETKLNILLAAKSANEWTNTIVI